MMQRDSENAGIIVLEDSDGAEIEFEVMDIVPYNGSEYAVLLPIDDDSDDVEAVVLQVQSDDESPEEELLIGIDDPAVLDAVFALFIKRSEME